MPPEVNAQVGTGAGIGGESAMIRLEGEVVKHADSVVLPLLLPDSPVAIWWPHEPPDDPAADPLGSLAKRRITDSAEVTRGKTKALAVQCASYVAGNTDLAWTRLTPWRALLAAALDQHQLKVTAATVTSERISPSADLLAGWLRHRLKVDVERSSSKGPGITDVVMETKEGPIRIARADGRLATFTSPGHPDRPIALKRRKLPELLAEELRRLDEDDVYAATIKSIGEAMKEPRIEVQPDAGALATAVAGELLSRLADAQASGHEPHIALTGGTIADAVHRELARLSPATEVDWSRVVVWWGDERFVAPDSADRNALAARAAFLDALGATQVHEMPSTADAADVVTGAAAYADTVREHGSGEFEVVMLGVGPDGHVASLFPGRPQLDVDDQVAVAVTDSPKPPPERITLTFPALNRARSVWFLVSGEAKADAVAAALADEGDVHDTPARGVAGRDETVWFLDREAASRL